MRYRTLVVDYDGTLATGERVAPATVSALGRARESGRDLVLVTGRELDELLDIFPGITLFDRVVAENGAVIYTPATGLQHLLGEPPSDAFVDDLRDRDVWPLSVGQVIVATWHPHEHAVLDAISRHGLELNVIFNRSAVMVLPPDITKASGLAVALRELRRSARNTICAGDAENDQSMFHMCERSVAVANAIPSVQAHADLVTHSQNGSGVVELVDRLLATDLCELDTSPSRHDIPVGICDERGLVSLATAGARLLIAGEPGSGKSYCTTGIIEQVLERGYQALVIDPEGDYGGIPGIIHLGNSDHAPDIGDILHALEQPEHSVAANLMAVPGGERAEFFNCLCDGVRDLRDRNGFPHWLIIDEAHHVMPGWMTAPPLMRSGDRFGAVIITVDPGHLNVSLLEAVNHLIVTGSSPRTTIEAFTGSTGLDAPELSAPEAAAGEALIWSPVSVPSATCLRLATVRSEHRRHLRKYAEGDMGPERSFYFHRSNGVSYERARNLTAFLSIGDEVDDATWTYHLDRHDYSRWVLGTIGDHDLANAIAAIETCPGMTPAESRAAVRAVIEERYTSPA